MIENTYGESQTNAKMMYYALCDSSNREEEKKHDHERTNKQTNNTTPSLCTSPLLSTHNTTQHNSNLYPSKIAPKPHRLRYPQTKPAENVGDKLAIRASTHPGYRFAPRYANPN